MLPTTPSLRLTALIGRWRQPSTAPSPPADRACTSASLIASTFSWNDPAKVRVRAELAQALAGNVVVAKTPTQGGLHRLTVDTLAHAFMARVGLPVTLGPGRAGG
jgi:hypothetical protein